jgi:hypothetical protein
MGKLGRGRSKIRQAFLKRAAAFSILARPYNLLDFSIITEFLIGPFDQPYGLLKIIIAKKN